MDDLYIMANIANAGTDSRRVYYSSQINEIMEEIEQDIMRDKARQAARAEGARAVYIARQERNKRFREQKVRRHYRMLEVACGLVVVVIMFCISFLGSVI